MATSTPLIEKAWWRTETRSTAEDSVVVALHGLLLSRDFVCVSISDEDFSEDQHAFSGSILSSPDSPALPEGWKKDGVYTLVYQKKTSGRRILIKGLKMDSDLLILNAAVAGTESVSNVTVTTSEFVNSAGGLDSMSGAFKDMDKMLSMLEKDLLSKVDPAPNTAKPTAAQSRPGDSHSSLPTPDGPSRPPPLAEPLRDPLRIGPPHYPQGHPLAGGIGGVPFGRGDLDPFNAGVGGGMMFDPLRVGGRHGGGLADPRLPPGARYDPVGPQPLGPRPPGRGGPSPGNYPDPDHLPPPGMGGNYYMAFKDMDKNLMLSMLEKDLASKVDPAPNTAKATAAQSRPGDSHSSLPTPDGPSRPPPMAEPLRDPLRIGPPHYPQGHPLAGGIGGVSLGRGDLDPLSAGVGGGMMFDPLRVGGRHGGGLADSRLPPGARFNPVGPHPLGPRPPGRGGPSPGNYTDPDHLPPPGMDESYYM